MQARHALLQELQRAIDPKIIVREGIDTLRQAHEPAPLGIARGKLGRHPERRQGGKVKRRATGQLRLHTLDYLVPRISIHS